MKPRILCLLACLLALPLMLAACGDNSAENAEKFIQALNDEDVQEAEKYVCDNPSSDLKEIMTVVAGGGEVDLLNIKCEKDGDDVKCTYNLGIGSRAQETITFAMEDNTVCAIK